MKAFISIFVSSFLFCNSLRVSNDRGRLILATHHKTGSALSSEVLGCIHKHTNYDHNSALLYEHAFQRSDQQPAKKDHVLHFLRHPVGWTISWYLYELSNSESWFAKNKFSVGSDSALGRYFAKNDVEILSGESTKDFVKRVPFNVGLAVGYSQLSNELKKIVKGAERCNSNPLCTQTCLESFTGGHSAYMAEWRRILDSAGIGFNENLRECIAKYDVQGKENSHSTSWRYSEEDMEKFATTVTDLDKELSDGDIFSKAVELFNCGMPKGFLFDKFADRALPKNEIFETIAQWE